MRKCRERERALSRDGEEIKHAHTHGRMRARGRRIESTAALVGDAHLVCLEDL